MPDALFEPLKIGAITVPNRVFMAPLTRMRATPPDDTPNDLMREYYEQRASAGLIVSEGTQISPVGKGYMDTPGIYSPEQVAGWRHITDAVHSHGGHIAAQAWHVGRVSHPSLQPSGTLPVSASALPFKSRTTVKGPNGAPMRINCETPHALTSEEIVATIGDYASAARNAREAGFDLVEIHGAHGYLLHQFLSPNSNERTDSYGGSVENRARLMLEALDASIDAWVADRIGIRISPMGEFNGVHDPEGLESALYLASEFARRGIAFLHLSEPDWIGGERIPESFRVDLRDVFPGVIIGAGSYDLDKARTLLDAGFIDAVAFGRPFIANPDLPARLRAGLPLQEVDPATLYGGGEKGYTDYPAHQ
jgi:N-ethylmaleimide reductase